ncbi:MULTISPECIES: tRNA (adenosine(37)-N6)-threonylcarbamoyltransferase complex dimerization subunit type 1 TsaB [unclassified Ruegeria]|uniref:tRNA (adenosine(37)-N6)-threonylcarbamoyltransferase complex dimerization subunit type 1 TsaB n=1 Tax=unclassified Ruegeria TaxID=2625375 RepID=UPI001487B37B|nr:MULTISPECIES: tRNA (adenosine(37)-N6)-threonylcarbamoyltransferase complex dimerization subunit type 1 TsaB [unclassified Ruegeria]NOD64168.1 tRNA (adenosine(37)-N6)-threonylcarbamoyltransferase complex dimerization subunit type 1 TsaB [Ruegeria sp. HKCCD6109]
MPSDPTILAFDTSAAHCAAALLRGDEIITSRAEAMSRGQAERLMPMLEDILAQGGCAWSDLDAIGVGVGPGNFTGIRISVSAARGLALGLGVPAVGVSGFDALMKLGGADQIPCIPAPRDQVYVQAVGDDPRLMPRVEAEALGSLFSCNDPDQHTQAIARLTAVRWRDVSAPPAPLYVRPADAAPSRDVPPVLLDE